MGAIPLRPNGGKSSLHHALRARHLSTLTPWCRMDEWTPNTAIWRPVTADRTEACNGTGARVCEGVSYVFAGRAFSCFGTNRLLILIAMPSGDRPGEQRLSPVGVMPSPARCTALIFRQPSGIAINGAESTKIPISAPSRDG